MTLGEILVGAISRVDWLRTICFTSRLLWFPSDQKHAGGMINDAMKTTPRHFYMICFFFYLSMPQARHVTPINNTNILLIIDSTVAGYSFFHTFNLWISFSSYSVSESRASFPYNFFLLFLFWPLGPIDANFSRKMEVTHRMWINISAIQYWY